MKKLLIIVFAVNMMLLDGIAVYWYLYGEKLNISEIEIPKGSSTFNEEINANQVDNCGSLCQKYIDEKISQKLAAFSPTPFPTKAPEINIPVSKAKIKSASYLPIPGSGNCTLTGWTNLSGTDFYLSKKDYPGLTEMYFEANVKLLNGNGTAYFRIYDVTHGIGVVGSEVTTSSQTSVFISSGKISLWEGYNHYVIQAKTLTADTAVFESGKLKIITEN